MAWYMLAVLCFTLGFVTCALLTASARESDAEILARGRALGRADEREAAMQARR